MHACTAREKTKIERPAVRAHIQLAHPLANSEPVDEHLNKLESVFSKISLFFLQRSFSEAKPHMIASQLCIALQISRFPLV
eukprot:18799_5